MKNTTLITILVAVLTSLMVSISAYADDSTDELDLSTDEVTTVEAEDEEASIAPPYVPESDTSEDEVTSLEE